MASLGALRAALHILPVQHVPSRLWKDELRCVSDFNARIFEERENTDSRLACLPGSDGVQKTPVMSSSFLFRRSRIAAILTASILTTLPDMASAGTIIWNGPPQ